MSPPIFFRAILLLYSDEANLKTIADKLKVSKSTVHNRIKRMRDEKFLNGLYPNLDTNKIAYIAPGFNTEVREELSSSLKTILPPNLNKYFFATSGTEANEASVLFYCGLWTLIP